MRQRLKDGVVCVTICMLFVLLGFANRRLNLLGPDFTGSALVTAVLPGGPSELALANGPILPPDPIDIPVLKARVANGPILPPDPIDIPAVKATNGPILPPDPIDIPSRARG